MASNFETWCKTILNIIKRELNVEYKYVAKFNSENAYYCKVFVFLLKNFNYN